MDTVDESPVQGLSCPAKVEMVYPLSPLQEGMLFHSVLSKGSGVDTVQVIADLREAINPPLFERAWQRAIARHAVLRTAFLWQNVEQPRQEVPEAVHVQIAKRDWSGFPPVDQCAYLESWLRNDRKRDFDLSRPPIMRWALFRVAESQSWFIWTFHHALLDARSFSLVLQEVFQCYDALCSGNALKLEAPPAYKDHIEWLRRQDWRKAESYWREQLKGFTTPTVLAVGATGPPLPDTESEPAEHQIELSRDLTEALRAFALRHGLMTNTLIQGAWAVLLSRFSGQDDVVFGAVRACRHSTVPGAESMVGLLINTVPVRVRLDRGSGLVPWLRRLREQWVQLRAYEQVPLLKIQQWSELANAASLFETLVNYQPKPWQAAVEAEARPGAKRKFWLRTKTNYAIMLDVCAEPRIGLKLVSERRRFDEASISRMLSHLHVVLEAMVADSTHDVGQLLAVNPKDQQNLSRQWNRTESSPDLKRFVWDMIEEQARRQPNSDAIVCRQDQLTYRQLWQCVERVADRLRALGIGAETLVGLCVKRSIEMVVALLGILKAGGAFVPLDPLYPSERLRHMLEDSQAAALITEEQWLGRLPGTGVRIISVDSLLAGDHGDWLKSQIGQSPLAPAASVQRDAEENIVSPAACPISPENLAYVIYTSGSTGKPKGVMVSHRNLANFLVAMDEVIGPESGTWLAVSRISFDISMLELLWTLTRGFKVILQYDPMDLPRPSAGESAPNAERGHIGRTSFNPRARERGVEAKPQSQGCCGLDGCAPLKMLAKESPGVQANEVENARGPTKPLGARDSRQELTSLPAELPGIGQGLTSPCLDAPAPREAIQETGNIDFGLFYFACDEGCQGAEKYRLLLDGARYADRHGFSAIWTPERHFHRFGGLYPNPSVTSAALAMVTERLQLRAGSVVLPLHNPIRVVEEWAVVDNLSKGRVGISFASGWHANDFVFAPEKFADRRERLSQDIELTRNLWRGKAIRCRNGLGEEIEVSILPRPMQKELPIWVTAASNPDTYRLAGELGANLLTNLLGQTVEELSRKIILYHQAWQKAGHGASRGRVALMLHTFVGEDSEHTRQLVRRPFIEYLKTSTDLIRKAKWEFPTFGRGAQDAGQFHPEGTLSAEAMEELAAYSFERYFGTSGLFGSPDECVRMALKLKAIGVDEIACLVDFGVEIEAVLASLGRLNEVRQRANKTECQSPAPLDLGRREPAGSEISPPRLAERDEMQSMPGESEYEESLPAQIERHQVTHLQCTPTLMTLWADDPTALKALARLRRLMLGGETLPAPLARRLNETLAGEIFNLYGPTETTIWSTAFKFDKGEDQLCVGRPIRSTQVYILDRHLQPVPHGVSGELFIGGEGVSRGYWNRPEWTAERFIPDPFSVVAGARLYRTGDTGRFLSDGNIELVGRLDQQVKIRGHRVELGEIESVLVEHPGVRAAVVLLQAAPVSDPARIGAFDGTGLANCDPVQGKSSGQQRLVAYVERRRPGSANDYPLTQSHRSPNSVSSWRSLWDETYRQTHSSWEPDFNLSGWKSSYDGAPLSHAEMGEWLELTVNRIAALNPKRILEVGCGTGLLLLRLAPQCETYHAVDFSPAALDYLELQLKSSGLQNVHLALREADDFSGMEAGAFDTVILNSVIQYFPNREYLLRVLEQACRVVAPGGHIFVGDVRSFSLLWPFHASVELHRAPQDLPLSELRERIRARVEHEQELLVSPDFFRALQPQWPRLEHVRIQIKQGRHKNELTAFRYDVALRLAPAQRSAEWGVGSAELEAQQSRPCSPERDSALPVTNSAFAWLDWRTDRPSLASIRRKLLETCPECFGIAAVSNTRLQEALSAWEFVNSSFGVNGTTAHDLRRRLAHRQTEAIDPADFWELSRELSYDVDLTWTGDGAKGEYDVLFRRRESPVSLGSDARGSVGRQDPSPDQSGDSANSVAAVQNLADLPVGPDERASVLEGGAERSEVAAFVSTCPTAPARKACFSNEDGHTNEPWIRRQANDLESELRNYLAGRMPEHMVPAAIVVVDEFPRTPNGKIDRSALTRPRPARTEWREESSPPRNHLEAQIASVFQELLQLDRVGMHENFFDLGAHSLIMMQVSVRLRETLHREVNLIDLFRYPTVHAFANFLESAAAEATARPRTSIRPRA